MSLLFWLRLLVFVLACLFARTWRRIDKYVFLFLLCFVLCAQMAGPQTLPSVIAANPVVYFSGTPLRTGCSELFGRKRLLRAPQGFAGQMSKPTRSNWWTKPLSIRGHNRRHRGASRLPPPTASPGTSCFSCWKAAAPITFSTRRWATPPDAVFAENDRRGFVSHQPFYVRQQHRQGGVFPVHRLVSFHRPQEFFHGQKTTPSRR